MNIHHVLSFCFFSALCGGNTRLVVAKVNIYTAAEGETGSINCFLSSYGSRKFFCRNQCKAEDILLKTDDVSAQRGRYSTEYRNSTSGRGILSVTITHLTMSDTGRYRCGLGKTLVPESYTDFEIRVSDAPLFAGKSGLFRSETEGEDFTYGCSNTVYGKKKFLCKDECKKPEHILIETENNQAKSGRYSIEYKQGSTFGLYVTITELTKLDTGRYRCGYGRPSSPDSYRDFHVIVINVPSTSTPPPTPTPTPTPTTQSQSSSSASFTPSVSSEATYQLTGYSLPLVVAVPFAFVLLAVFLLLLYKWRTKRDSGVNNRGNADDLNMEASATYENLAPVSSCEDSIYENLHPVSKDQDHIYSTI